MACLQRAGATNALTTAGEAAFPIIVQRGLRRSRIWVTSHYGITRRGDLVFVPGSNGAVGRFVTMRPGETTRVLPIPAREHLNFSVARDGARIAATARGVEGIELWVYDNSTGRGERVAVAFSIGQPEWTPDGTLVFQMRGTVGGELVTVLKPALSRTADTLAGFVFNLGQVLTRTTMIGTQSADVVVAHQEGGRVRADTLRLPDTQWYPVASPDMRWLAYSGRESGIVHVFVTPLPRLERQYKVSIDTGSEALWLPDGSLVYRTGWCWYRLQRVPTATPPLGEPSLYFCDEDMLNTSGRSNTTLPDGSILYLRSVAPSTGGYVRVVKGWAKRMREEVRKTTRQ